MKTKTENEVDTHPSSESADSCLSNKAQSVRAGLRFFIIFKHFASLSCSFVIVAGEGPSMFL